MDRGLKELLSALNARNVRYVVVGGYAVGVYSQPRVTKDPPTSRPITSS